MGPRLVEILMCIIVEVKVIPIKHWINHGSLRHYRNMILDAGTASLINGSVVKPKSQASIPIQNASGTLINKSLISMNINNKCMPKIRPKLSR